MSTELTGAAAAESDAGFKPMTPASREAAEFKTARAAAASRSVATAEPEAILYLKDGGRAPANQTVKLTEAADDLTAYRSGQSDQRALSISADFAEAIDRLRAEGVTVADEVPPALPDPAIVPAQAAPVANDNAEIERFLAVPAVRGAVEQLMAEVEQSKEIYTQARAAAQQFAQAALRIVAPELEQIPIEQFQRGLETLRTVNPARYQQIAALLDQVGRLQAAQLHEEAMAAQQRAAWAAEQNKLFDRVVPMTPEAKKQVAAEMVDYAAAELGIGYNQLVHYMKTEPVLQSAAFQKVIHDAVQARITQKAAQNWRNKKAAPIPPVQKPGTTTLRSERTHADLRTLDGKLDQSGSLQDAYKLILASRRGGK